MLTLKTDEKFIIKFENGDQANGKIDYSLDKKTIIESETFGVSEIKPSQIVSMRKDFSEIGRNNRTETISVTSPRKKAKSTEYGEEKKKTAPLEFLIGSTVLLSPGQYEIDFGLGYKTTRTSYSLQQTGYFDRSAYTARQLHYSAALRGGITEGLETYINLPYTYSHIEEVSTNVNVRDTSEWQLGDISFGLQYLLIAETAKTPAVSFSFDVAAPTGKKEYRDFTQNWKDPLDNSSGHWSVAPGFTFVRTTDPAILFAGISYRYSFDRKIDDYEIRLGGGLETYIGLGFSLNEKLSIGSRLAYSYNSRMKANGQTIYGSDTDPLDISFSASYSMNENWTVTPRITYSLNNDAGPSAIQLNIKRRFQ